MNIGVIIESNPFHNGHKYLIDYIKNNFNPDCITTITSTSFNMRGEISPITKFDKINYLLQGGANLVLELPSILALHSADLFAFNAVKILKGINVTDIVCGCETDDIRQIEKLVEVTSSKTFDDILLSFIKDKKYSYKNASLLALEKMNIDQELINLFTLPNATLAITYLKAIKLLNSSIKLHLVKRIKVDYNSTETNGQFASATSIRTKLLNNEQVNNFIPFEQKFIDLNKAIDKYYDLIKYRLLVSNLNNNRISNINEGIDNYIINNGDFNNNYETFINNLSNKKYTKNRIQRAIFHLLLNTPNNYSYENYIRVLGFDNLGMKYLNMLPKDIKNTIFSSPKENNAIENNLVLQYELKTTRLFEILSNQDLYIKEFQLPIRKE